MNRIYFFGIYILIIFIFFVFFQKKVCSQTFPMRVIDVGDQEINVVADEIIYDAKNRIYWAKGSVTITRGNVLIRAEEVAFNESKREVIAQGNVFFTDGENIIDADRIVFQIDEKRGVIYNGKGIFPEKKREYEEKGIGFIKKRERAPIKYYVHGKRIEKYEEEAFIVEDGYLTTCECEDIKDAGWVFYIERADLTVNGMAWIKGLWIYIWNRPIFYLPYGVFPVKIIRQSGFLTPTFANSSKYGFITKIPFYLVISRTQDMTFDLEYRSKRGIKPGIEYRYAIIGGKGGISFDFIKDIEIKRNRWDFLWKHDQKITDYEIDVKADVNLISDDDYIKDFGEDLKARTSRELISSAFLSKKFKNNFVILRATNYNSVVDGNDDFIFQRYPNLTFFIHEDYLFNTQLSLTAQGEITNFYRKEGVRGQRLDLNPQIFLPLRISFINITQSAGLRETYYFLNENTDSSLRREILWTSFEGSFELERYFRIPAWKDYEIRHVISPDIKIEFSSVSFEEDREIFPTFDNIDRIRKRNLINFSIANFLYIPEKKDGDLPRSEFLLGRLYFNYDLNAGEKPFSDLAGEFRISLFEDFYVNTNLYFDPYNGRMRRLNTNFNLKFNDDVNLYLDYQFSKPFKIDTRSLIEITDYSAFDIERERMNNIIFGAGFIISKRITIDLKTRYSFLIDQMLESIYTIGYTSDQKCWSVTMSIENRKRPHETRAILLFNFTGIGSIGI